jgi:glycosyl transferase family 87
MTATAAEAKSNRYWYILLIPIVGALFILIALRVVSPVEYANSDFFTFWLSGRFVLTAQNPYSADLWVAAHHQFGATWISDMTYIYPLPLSLFFVPLGLLPLYQAFVLWVALTQLMLLISVSLLLKPYSFAVYKHYLAPLLAGIVLFRATIVTLHNGQISGLLLLTTALIAYLWGKGRWWQGSIFLPILALKPNLGLPIILLLSVYLVFRKQIRALLAAAGAGLVLVCIGLLQDPNWIVEFWRAGNAKLSATFGYSPTIWGVSAYLCNHNLACTAAYGGAAGVLLLIGCIYVLGAKNASLPPIWAISFAVTVTLLLTPYTWPYDQLLLIIPIITVVMHLARRGFPFLPTALLFVGIDILAFIVLGISAGIQIESWSAVIPLWVLALLAGMLWKGTKPGNALDGDEGLMQIRG